MAIRIFQGGDDRYYLEVSDASGHILTTEGSATVEATRALGRRLLGEVLRKLGSTIPAFAEDDPTATMRVSQATTVEPAS